MVIACECHVCLAGVPRGEAVFRRSVDVDRGQRDAPWMCFAAVQKDLMVTVVIVVVARASARQMWGSDGGVRRQDLG